MVSSARVPLACAFIAAGTAFLAALTTISVAEWKVTALVRMAEEQPLADLARETDPDFHFVHYHGRGDGVYYYAIARDPFARGEEHRLFVWSAYRYGHPGFSWAAWLVSASNALLIPYAFLILNLLGMGVAAAIASLISRDLGHSPWGGLVVALNPGLIYATTIDTNEPLAAAILALVLLAWLRDRLTLGLPLLAALCFMKEWYVLVAVGLAVWELLQYRRSGIRRAAVRTSAIAASVVPFAIWYGYVIARFDGWPAAPAGELLQLPLIGWIRTARLGAGIGMQTFDRVVVGHVTVPVLAVVGLALGLGALRALRLSTPIHLVYLCVLPLFLGLNSLNLLFVKDLMRTLAIPLALVPAIVVNCDAWTRRRAPGRHVADRAATFGEP